MRVDAAVQIIHAGGGHWFEEQKNTSVEINTFSSVPRSVDHWAAASICYKDVIHSNYCACEFPTKVGFKNKL